MEVYSREDKEGLARSRSARAEVVTSFQGVVTVPYYSRQLISRR